MEDGELQTGVGIFFKLNESKHPVVESLLPSGSADRAGGIEVGDVLVKVGNVLCERLSMDRIRTLVCGPLGSYVSMAFRRRALDGSFVYYEIQLVRGSGQYLDLIERFISSHILFMSEF
jgi:C-terminal processing protease CtpA/Prc